MNFDWSDKNVLNLRQWDRQKKQWMIDKGGWLSEKLKIDLIDLIDENVIKSDQ
jgi:hypothetical protein